MYILIVLKAFLPIFEIESSVLELMR